LLYIEKLNKNNNYTQKVLQETLLNENETCSASTNEDYPMGLHK